MIEIFLLIVAMTLALEYVNYRARVSFKLLEMNPIWRWFDKRGLTWMSLMLHFCIVVGLTSVFLFVYGLAFSLGVFVGFISLNLVADYLTLSKNKRCMTMCPDYKKCVKRRESKCFPLWSGETGRRKKRSKIFIAFGYILFVEGLLLIFLAVHAALSSLFDTALFSGVLAVIAIYLSSMWRRDKHKVQKG